MDKQAAKRLGGWVSLIGGTIFLAGALSAIYIAFFMPPETATHLLLRIAHLLRHG